VPYPESFIGPMRQELTRLGVQELRTAADVDALLARPATTVMLVVNSMCGCAAGKARPGISLAILRDGKLLYMMHRSQIENQTADAIARQLTDAFDRLCVAPAKTS
jgi:hypothetical protein